MAVISIIHPYTQIYSRLYLQEAHIYSRVKWKEEDTRLGVNPVNVKSHLLIVSCITGILTPAAGRATQHLPGPRVVEGVLPAGRALLVGRFILGARHGDFLFLSSCCFFFVCVFFLGKGIQKCAAFFFSPFKKMQKSAAGDVMRRRSR